MTKTHTMDAMSWTVDNLMNNPHTSQNHKICYEQYLQWARGFVFEAMRDQRYGQSFCNHFGISDNILYYAGTVAEADRYIRENYIE